MNKSFLISIIIVLVGGLLFLTLHRHFDSDLSNNTNTFNRADVILKTYKVKAGYADELKNLMNRSFRSMGDDKGSIARIDVLPNGDLALLAPKFIHSGFQDVLSNMASQENTFNHKNYKIQCWFVLEFEGDISRRSMGKFYSIKEKFALNMLPNEIVGALKSAENNKDKSYMLAEKISFISSERNRSMGKGLNFRVSTSLERSHGKVLGNFEISGKYTSLESAIYMEHDKILIIGESTIEADHLELKYSLNRKASLKIILKITEV